VLAILQISTDLERIGDYARSIARFMKDRAEDEIEPQLLVDTQLDKIAEQVLSMLKMTQAALESESVEIAHSVFEKDRIVNKMREDATNVLAETLINCQDSASAKKILHLQDVIRKMERTGDHIKNIAEEIIFYVDAKVLRHKGKTSE
jgi:phosphate transport system protein